MHSRVPMPQGAQPTGYRTRFHDAAAAGIAISPPGESPRIAAICGAGGTWGGEPPQRRHASAAEANVAADWHEWREGAAYTSWEGGAEQSISDASNRLRDRAMARHEAVTRRSRPGLGRR